MGVGIALEGGGAKGAFHIGALKALQENGYTIDGIVGTSIGAFNAALVCQGDFEKAYDLWATIEPSTLFDIEDEHMKRLKHAELTKDTLKYLSLKTKDVWENKGIDTSRLRGVLDTFIDEERLRASAVDFGLVTVSVSDRKPVEIYKEDIPEGMLKDYIMASASFPGFQLNPIEGKYFIDGGVYDNCPVNLLIRKGYTDIIAIRTVQREKLSRKLEKEVNLLNITPSEDLGHALIFDNESIQESIQLGYYDALKALYHLKGLRYYVAPYEEEAFFQIIEGIPASTILQIGTALKLPEMDARRLLFEKIMPTVAELLKLPITATYQDIFIGLLEVIAAECGLERFKVYTMKDFIEAIEEAVPKESLEARKTRHLFDLKTLATQLLGKHMLDEIAYVVLDAVPLGTFKIEDAE